MIFDEETEALGRKAEYCVRTEMESVNEPAHCQSPLPPKAAPTAFINSMPGDLASGEEAAFDRALSLFGGQIAGNAVNWMYS